MLPLLDDQERSPMRVRVVGCTCGEPDCEARFVAASTVARPGLWVVSVYAEDAVGAARSVEFLLANERPEGGDGPFEVVERACGLVGLTWRRLTSSVDAAVRQFEAFTRLPQWMFRMDPDRIFAVRRCVYGDDLVRVPRALWALHGSYVNEGPAVEVRR